MSTNLYDITENKVTLESLANISRPVYVSEFIGLWSNYNQRVAGLEGFMSDEKIVNTKKFELNSFDEIKADTSSHEQTEYKAFNTIKVDAHTHYHYSQLLISSYKPSQITSVNDLKPVVDDVLSKLGQDYDKDILNGSAINKGLLSDVTPQSSVNLTSGKQLADLIIDKSMQLNDDLRYSDDDPLYVAISGSSVKSLLNQMYNDYKTMAEVLNSHPNIRLWKLSNQVSSDNKLIFIKPQETKLFWSVSPALINVANDTDGYGFPLNILHFGYSSASMYKNTKEAVVNQPVTVS